VTAARAWEALPLRLRAALASGSSVVTPNKRLARRLAAIYDGAQHAEGHAVWEAPVILPWSSWLERLWLDVLISGRLETASRLMTPVQCAFLWKRIVAADHLSLIDERGVGALADAAWSIVQAWGAGGPSWRGWSGGDDDRAAFARWADAFSERLAATSAVDFAQLPDWLARHAAQVSAWRGASTTLAGFIDESPQQQRLFAALVAAGMDIGRCATVRAATGTVARVAATTPRDEMLRALEWARDRASIDPGASIGIAVEDLASRRDEIRALADEVLCPALQWPGHEDAVRPYNLSLGVAASAVPILTAALDLIALAHGTLPMGRAAALLRSPYVAAEPDGWLRGSQLEADWLDEGRRDIAFDEAIAALSGVDRALAVRWRSARDALRRPASATPREWTGFWRAWLDATGWPGERPQSSTEWQARNTWDDLLAQFAAFGWVSQRISAADALASLQALAGDHVFQPESAPAPVEILGGLEAAGLPFDALWVGGLAAEAWPPAPRPNPLVPLAWQRERNAPHATAARELAYAQALTAQWAHGASEVIFSVAQNVDDHVRAMSSLVPPGPPFAARRAETTAELQFASAPAAEAILDDRAPAVALGTRVSGGTTLVAAQSDCPFQAMARFRLATRPWPQPAAGLRPFERGILVHAALAAFWRDIHDHAALVALAPDALGARIAAASEAALNEIPGARWRRVPAAVRAGEAPRIASILRAWIEGFERPRPAFSVELIETRRRLRLAGLDLDFRLDRVDTLASGGATVVDYKAGIAIPPAKWFDARPQAPQIGLYVLAERVSVPKRPIRAAAYAQLKAGELSVRGIAADADAWPGLAAPQRIRGAALEDWPAVEAHWARALEALAIEVREGHAAVTPRDVDTTCRICRLWAFCRIGAPPGGALAESGDA
jgi:ATP-dependent helicase/nuclease subunit B